jgi:hypothetical protein
MALWTDADLNTSNLSVARQHNRLRPTFQKLENACDATQLSIVLSLLIFHFRFVFSYVIFDVFIFFPLHYLYFYSTFYIFILFYLIPITFKSSFVSSFYSLFFQRSLYLHSLMHIELYWSAAVHVIAVCIRSHHCRSLLLQWTGGLLSIIKHPNCLEQQRSNIILVRRPSKTNESVEQACVYRNTLRRI